MTRAPFMVLTTGNAGIQGLLRERRPIMNGHRNQQSARYGIDVRGFHLHAEADELKEVLAVLNGHASTVSVIDRQRRTVVCDGRMEEVRKAIRSAIVLEEKEPPDTSEQSERPRVYAVDIRGFHFHAEADELKQVLARLNGHAGMVSIIDRQRRTVVCDGLMEEVRETIRNAVARQGIGVTHADERSECPRV